jgi:hypothetical protein
VPCERAAGARISRFSLCWLLDGGKVYVREGLLVRCFATCSCSWVSSSLHLTLQVSSLLTFSTLHGSPYVYAHAALMIGDGWFEYMSGLIGLMAKRSLLKSGV